MTQLQYMDIPTLELLNYLHPRLKEFVTHNFVARWQDKVQQLQPCVHFIVAHICVGIYVHYNQGNNSIFGLTSYFFMKAFLKDIPNGTILSCIDFFENYAFKTQNEVQDMHWYNFQISILVHITYRVNPEFSTIDPQSFIILQEVHYYISDDKTHDNFFV